ncbi:unnamed protein product [Schistocephalus solidus]|uniref:Fuz_longin_1 domain-containing protein n=1 Tax=Schistocephalus solidus TaxID=70667 RepID=A0A183T2W1_SCHSO|nr:unnamed protein product [Schistocephalus solidus]
MIGIHKRTIALLSTCLQLNNFRRTFAIGKHGLDVLDTANLKTCFNDFLPGSDLGAASVCLLGVDSEEACSFQHFCALDPVLPSLLQFSAEAAEMEVTELTCLLLVNRSGLCSIQQHRQDDSFVHLEFGTDMETEAIPDDVLHMSKVLADFEDPMGDLIVDFGGSEEVAAPVGEVVHGIQLSAIDVDERCCGRPQTLLGPTPLFKAPYHKVMQIRRERFSTH